MQSLLTVLVLIFTGISLAAPHGGQPVSQGNSSPQDTVPTSTVTLPGFNHLAQNKTHAVIESSDHATFEGTCVQITLGGHGKVGMTTLEGRCVDDAGLWWETSLNLNSCIGNIGGNLVYQTGGAFDATCRPCTLDIVHDGSNILLKCNCLDEARFPRYTALEMGSGVSNTLAVRPVNGRLICGNYMGIKSPTFI